MGFGGGSSAPAGGPSPCGKKRPPGAGRRGRGAAPPPPPRKRWPKPQPIGEAYYSAGCRGVLAPSAAHVGGKVLAIFRAPKDPMSGLESLPPPNHYDELPAPPTGLLT